VIGQILFFSLLVTVIFAIVAWLVAVALDYRRPR
jgi:hypothetical protein